MPRRYKDAPSEAAKSERRWREASKAMEARLREAQDRLLSRSPFPGR
jgi:hypothetical protein